MPDWGKLVRQRLRGLALDAVEKEEVHAEFAAHLEESYECFRREGLSEKEAVQRTLAQVPDWHDLRWRVFFAKRRGNLMKKRLHQLWIPGFVALILSAGFLMALQKLGFQPRIGRNGPPELLLYVPWLLSLPFIGALGALVSSRAGGSRGTMLLASVFPALALATAFLLMSPIGMIVERIIGNDLDFRFVARLLLKDGIGWILIPGAALLVGGLLAQLLLNPRSTSRNIAIG
jgi:hypothetical protein